MSDDEKDGKSEGLETEVQEMHIKVESPLGRDASDNQEGSDTVNREPSTAEGSPVKHETVSRSHSHTPMKSQSSAQSPHLKSDSEETIGGEITVKVEPGQVPKLARKSSQKVMQRPAQLFLDHEDRTEEARTTFDILDECTYANKYIGTTDHALECECQEEWDAASATNYACGEDSDCINRATKMECIGDCGCGTLCQNQRFQQRQYATVAVIKTEKKGYGLRAEKDLRPNDFIFEYIGEVITEATFRRRMPQYSDAGIKHFYFMSLSKGEFIDATKKGNLGRFCNHSCNPNCYVDKWVVGDRLRMGIFAERKIKAGEELVFNYNVDRYGADAQPCYCGEPNCTGFIGGKTQTGRATKLSNAVIEALGIDDGDGWDTAVAKKPRKKKAGEEDEEYVNNVQPRALDEDAVTKVMASLMQCKEKWIAVKLLGRLQRADSEKVRNRVVKMHGYRILKTTLSTWQDDANVLLQVFDILDTLPRLTRNKIQDSKIEETVQELASREQEGFAQVRERAKSLLNVWSKLEVGYRIPRMKRDANTNKDERRPDRAERRTSMRDRSKSRTRSPSLEAPKGPSAAPSGPRGAVPQRAPGFFGGPPRAPAFRRGPPPLPAGWTETRDEKGRTYFYTVDGNKTQWQRPTAPATLPPPPPPPPAAVDPNKQLNDIINSIVNQRESKPQTPMSVTPKPTDETPKKNSHGKTEKWRALPEEKQKKIYANTLAPHIQQVMNKYKGKLPKEDLKRLAKEVTNTMVNSDYKHSRVQDPTDLSSDRVPKIREYVKKFFAKAHHKLRDRQKEKGKEKKANGEHAQDAINTPTKEAQAERNIDGEDMEISDPEPDPDDEKTTPVDTPPTQEPSPNELKRKLEEANGALVAEDGSSSPSKRVKSETLNGPPAPPPPPPPTEPPPDMDEDEDEDMMEANTLSGEEAVDPFRSGDLEAIVAAPVNGLKAKSNQLSTTNGLETSYMDGARDTPTQLATPPNWPSSENAIVKQQDATKYEGMDPQRLQQLETDATGANSEA
ncbi:hypothetical protein EV356DRAFT_534948 [Viridothelium virens]|uniref:Histone-lysine N-methyltransferase, H3 lysine-36 specific n=1 Tax=Viridothelium virens TaxID=1048519 RepID=A0A6A6H2B4_VIRVR|nr:hypothetical protein EV356DRAFT_534948 [Viridothelium virens]